VGSPRTRTLRTVAGAVVVLSAAAIAAGLLLRQNASGSGRSSLLASLPLAPISSLHGLLPAPSPGPPGSEAVPVPAGRPLARAGAPAPGSTVDGRRYLGNPRGIPLLAHAQIRLDVGRPLVAPETIDFPPGL
jgi:hypothetical protein